MDAADYVVWRNTLGSTGLRLFSGADGDGDGVVDQDDYSVWAAHFGQKLPAAGAGAQVKPPAEPGAVGVAPASTSIGDSSRQPPALPGVRAAARDPQASSFVVVDARMNTPAKPGAVERSKVARLGESRELARRHDDALWRGWRCERKAAGAR